MNSMRFSLFSSVSATKEQFPSPPVLGGRGVRGEGAETARNKITPPAALCPPSPQPSPPEYGGRGSPFWSRLARWQHVTFWLLLAALPAAQSQEKAPLPAPPVSITLLDRHGHVTPSRAACSHTGGGNIDVQQPAPDTVVVTMTGAVVAESSMHFDLEQCFEVSFDNPKFKKAKLTIEGRVIGLLRGAKKGSASYSDACASVGIASEPIMNICVPPHAVDGCDNLAVNDHAGPLSVPIAAGKYTLQQTFNIAAQGKCAFSK